MTPLMYAAQAGHERMAVLLLRLRADRYRCNDKVGRGFSSQRYVEDIMGVGYFHVYLYFPTVKLAALMFSHPTPSSFFVS